MVPFTLCLVLGSLIKYPAKKQGCPYYDMVTGLLRVLHVDPVKLSLHQERDMSGQLVLYSEL